MNLPNEALMKKVYWVNIYYYRINKLFDAVHKSWLDEAVKHYDSEKHLKLTEMKNRIYFKLRIIHRYSSILTSKALIEISK